LFLFILPARPQGQGLRTGRSGGGGVSLLLVGIGKLMEFSRWDGHVLQTCFGLVNDSWELNCNCGLVLQGCQRRHHLRPIAIEHGAVYVKNSKCTVRDYCLAAHALYAAEASSNDGTPYERHSYRKSIDQVEGKKGSSLHRMLFSNETRPKTRSLQGFESSLHEYSVEAFWQ
jgi:hypothetical protein